LAAALRATLLASRQFLELRSVHTLRRPTRRLEREEPNRKRIIQMSSRNFLIAGKPREARLPVLAEDKASIAAKLLKDPRTGRRERHPDCT
jgi:hypothetical protein